MANGDFFGRYNGICFIRKKGLFSELVDRGYRKQPVCFRESLTALHGQKTGEELTLMTQAPNIFGLDKNLPDATTEDVRIENNEFVVFKEDQTEFTNGFGRNLKYQVIDTAPGRSAILLTVMHNKLNGFIVQI